MSVLKGACMSAQFLSICKLLSLRTWHVRQEVVRFYFTLKGTERSVKDITMMQSSANLWQALRGNIKSTVTMTPCACSAAALLEAHLLNPVLWT